MNPRLKSGYKCALEPQLSATFNNDCQRNTTIKSMSFVVEMVEGGLLYEFEEPCGGMMESLLVMRNVNSQRVIRAGHDCRG